MTINKNKEKPFFRNFNEKDWEFVYPPAIRDEHLSDTFWEAADMLDYSDEAAEEAFKKIIAKYPYPGLTPKNNGLRI